MGPLDVALAVELDPLVALALLDGLAVTLPELPLLVDAPEAAFELTLAGPLAPVAPVAPELPLDADVLELQLAKKA